MTVLITGAAGYIGSHTAYAFQEAGISLVALDNLSTGQRALIPPGVPFFAGDIQNPALVDEICSAHPIDTVIHFAGSIVVAESVQNPVKYYTNNTSATLSLMNSCVRNGVKNVIFSSTASIYGASSPFPLKETEPARPESPYAASKWMSERMIADIARANPGLNTTILRYFNVAGADPQGRTGQVAIGATHLIKVACEVALGERPQIEIFGTDYETPDGTCIRDYIHVSDLATAHLKAYLHMRTHPGAHVFNCGYGTGFSVRQVIAEVERVIGHPIAKVESARRPGDSVSVIADSSALRAATGWQPAHQDLGQIIASALAWEKRWPVLRQKNANPHGAAA